MSHALTAQCKFTLCIVAVTTALDHHIKFLCAAAVVSRSTPQPVAETPSTVSLHYAHPALLLLLRAPSFNLPLLHAFR
jgi:hypothetical protein